MSCPLHEIIKLISPHGLQSMATLKLELRQAEERADALVSLDKLRQDLCEKQCELAWVVVNRREKEFEQMQEKVTKHQKDRAKYEKKVSDAKVIFRTYILLHLL